MNRVEAKSVFNEGLRDKFDERSIEFLWRELSSSRDWTDKLEISAIEIQVVIDRLIEDEPIQYITGRAYFYDFELNVSPATLIPRSETEELVDWIIQDSDEESCTILDIGTGSGCIPLALKKHVKNAIVEAVDVSKEAIVIAEKNSRELGLDVRFFEANVLEVGRFENTYDVIVSNPPYIPNSEKSLMSNNVLDHEPHLALFVENDDPLVFYRKIAAIATSSLSKGGKLYFECNEHNAKDVVEMLEKEAWNKIVIKQDLQGKDRMIRATRM